MKKLLVGLAALILIISWIPAQAQKWNPNYGWKDSYAVDGKCYCDSNGYDHGLDTKTVMTPQGRKSVVEVCQAITRVLGKGSPNGRVPYNDIQCGHGPANDAPDEAGCPGRVDIGEAGCDQKGPTWDLASVYGTGGQGNGNGNGNSGGANGDLPRVGWSASASSGSAEKALDGSIATRWATFATQKPGQYFQLDAGKLVTFDSIELNAGPDPFDYPRQYNVWVSDDGKSWRGPIAEGKGVRAITDIDFPQQTARFIRINQTGSDDYRWWSIAEVKLQLTGGTASSSVLDTKGWSVYASSDPINTRAAIDGKNNTRWSTGWSQRPGQFFQIDMLQTQRFNKIVLATMGSPNDYPRSYNVFVSNDGAKWGESPIATGQGNGPITTIAFATRDARYIRIEQTGNDKFYWWSIHELAVHRAD
jgi:F5/8 type C domain